jgi:hypothetical protein
MLGGIFFGALLRKALPRHHLSEDSQDVIRLGVGLIGTISALVLGLLIAAAKSSSDTQIGQVKQITADFILLDNLLAEYGPEALPIRSQMRSAIGPFADRLWHEKSEVAGKPFEATAPAQEAYLSVQALSPMSDIQRSLQVRAVQISNDLVQARFLLFVQSENSIPIPFLAILAFWLVLIFTSFSLFSRLNATVFAFLSLFALSASCALFLILELNQPFTGLMRISSAPLRNALGPLGP